MIRLSALEMELLLYGISRTEEVAKGLSEVTSYRSVPTWEHWAVYERIICFLWPMIDRGEIQPEEFTILDKAILSYCLEKASESWINDVYIPRGSRGKLAAAVGTIRKLRARLRDVDVRVGDIPFRNNPCRSPRHPS